VATVAIARWEKDVTAPELRARLGVAPRVLEQEARSAS
jgi:hypothetical protein